jgi:hypothetical protein
MVPELRARGIGEILDAAVGLYRARFSRLLRVTATVVVPLQLFTALILLSAQPDRYDISGTGTPTPVFDNGDAAVQLGAQLLVIAVAVLSQALVVAVSTRIVADAYVGHDEPVASAWREARRRYFAVLGVTVLVALAQFAGALACGVGTLIPMALFAVAVPVLILEHVGVGRALGRSVELTKSKFWHVLGVVLSAQLLSVVLQLGLTALVEFAFTNGSSTTLVIMQTVANAIAVTLTLPFVATTTVTLYFDMRTRVEAFDVQMLMQQVDARHAAAAAPAASISP